MISLILSMDVTCYKGKQLTLYITKTTQLPDSIMSAGNANHILFFFFSFFFFFFFFFFYSDNNHKSKYFKNHFLIVCTF